MVGQWWVGGSVVGGDELRIPLAFYVNKLCFRTWGRSGSQESSVPLPSVSTLKKPSLSYFPLLILFLFGILRMSG